MARPSIEVEGADELRRALRRVEDGTSDLKAAHADAAKIVERDAASRTRVATGRMRASVRSSGQARQGVVRAGFARLPYVGVQHFGWAARNISPNPFLYDALDARSADVLDEYERQINDLLEKHDLIS